MLPFFLPKKVYWLQLLFCWFTLTFSKLTYLILCAMCWADDCCLARQKLYVMNVFLSWLVCVNMWWCKRFDDELVWCGICIPLIIINTIFCTKKEIKSISVELFPLKMGIYRHHDDHGSQQCWKLNYHVICSHFRGP